MRITRTLVGALTVVLAAPLTYADRERGSGSAQHRTGSDSGSKGSSASAGSRHHSGSSNRAQPRGGGSVSPSTASAASRHPRAGTGTGRHRGGYHGGYGGYYGGYYGRGYYDSFYSPYYWGYYPYGFSWYGDWGWGSYAWSRPHYRVGYYSTSGYRGGGSLRVLVKPEQTRVYVDGYYAGVADDFDGLLQRLNVPTGRHEIAFKLDGYRSHRMQVYVAWDRTMKLRHEMVKGEGESTEDLVPPDAARRDRAEWVERDDRDDRYDRDRDRGWARDRDRGGERDRDSSLTLEVEPADASVYVDGEFRGTAGELRQLALTPGKHRIEIVRPGYVTLERDVEVAAGAEPLTARLEKK